MPDDKFGEIKIPMLINGKIEHKTVIGRIDPTPIDDSQFKPYREIINPVPPCWPEISLSWFLSLLSEAEEMERRLYDIEQEAIERDTLEE